MRFHYKAKKTSGEEYEKTVDAKDKFALFDLIKKEGGILLSVEEEQGTKGLSFKRLESMLGSVRMHEKIIFARNLGAMLEAGLPVSRALDVMERQMKNPKLKEIFRDLNARISKGDTLSGAMQAHPKVFSQLFISMTRAGEESGGLAESLRVIARQMEQVYTLKKKVRGAMMYPAIVMIAMVLIGILLLTFVVPTLSATFSDLGTELPRSTRAIITVSDFMRNNVIATLLITTSTIAGFIIALRTKRGKRAFEFTLLHTPLIAGLVRETNSARASRTLSSLLSAGVEFVAALEITHDVVQNSYFKEVLKRAQESIQKGTPISEVFRGAERLYPPFVSEMIAVGEETGKLSEMLTRVAEFYEEEVSQKTKDMSTVIEPFLMITIGIVVGFFAISMIQPIYSLSTAI